MLGAGEGRAGTSSFKWKASRDHYVHPCWPEAENPTDLQRLRGLCCSSHPVPRSYSSICFPGSKLFLRQTESQFPCMWAEQYERLVCFSSFTFCSQMVVPHPGKEQGWCLQRQSYTWISTAPSLHLCAEGWLPWGTASAAMHWGGKTFELHSLIQDQAEGQLGLICLGDLGLVTSVSTTQYSGDQDGTKSLILLCSILAHHFPSPSATGPKLGTRIWARRGQAATAVMEVLCWYCCEWQVPLPSPLWVGGANPQTTKRFRPRWQQHTTRGMARGKNREPHRGSRSLNGYHRWVKLYI